LDYIELGKPQQNGFTENLNGRIRDEFLYEHWFTSLAEARYLAEQWRDDYNHVSPHSSLNYQTPKEFAQNKNALIQKPQKLSRGMPPDLLGLTPNGARPINQQELYFNLD
jgi:hypothetical protein